MISEVKKVSILTTSHSTFDTRVFHKEARSLADAGHDVTLITPHGSDMERDGVKIRSVGTEDVASANLNHARQVYARAKQIDTDVYHFHDPGLIPFGVLLSYNTDGKVVYDCHEDYGRSFKFYDFPPDYLNPITTRFYPTVQSFAAKRMDAVVAATEWIAEDFRDRGHENVALVRNFPRISILESNSTPVEADHEHTLVYVGTMSGTRGLFRMLHLLDELRTEGIDVGLWLIGSLTGEVKEKTETFAKENELENHIQSFGYIEPENLPKYLKAADIGLSLLNRESYEYGIPTKVFEYMFFELPVVATRTTATERYLPDNCGRLVSEQLNDWVSAVTEILTDAELQKEMGQNGRDKVESEYCWEKEEKNLLSLYEGL